MSNEFNEGLEAAANFLEKQEFDGIELEHRKDAVANAIRGLKQVEIRKLRCNIRWEKRMARVNFVKQHPELWDSDRREIVMALKGAGLISQSTYHGDVRTDEYIAEARKVVAK
jgi:hypothetical protein